MAAVDTKRKGLHNQKRSVCVMVSGVLASAAAVAVPERYATVSDGSTIAALPDKALITAVTLQVDVASAASDTLDVTYGGTVVANEIAASALGAIKGTVITTAAFRAAGGDIVVKDGAQPVDANFRGRLLIEYIELDKVTGEYTGE